MFLGNFSPYIRHGKEAKTSERLLSPHADSSASSRNSRSPLATLTPSRDTGLSPSATSPGVFKGLLPQSKKMGQQGSHPPQPGPMSPPSTEQWSTPPSTPRGDSLTRIMSPPTGAYASGFGVRSEKTSSLDKQSSTETSQGYLKRPGSGDIISDTSSTASSRRDKRRFRKREQDNAPDRSPSLEPLKARVGKRDKSSLRKSALNIAEEEPDEAKKDQDSEDDLEDFYRQRPRSSGGSLMSPAAMPLSPTAIKAPSVDRRKIEENPPVFAQPLLHSSTASDAATPGGAAPVAPVTRAPMPPIDDKREPVLYAPVAATTSSPPYANKVISPVQHNLGMSVTSSVGCEVSGKSTPNVAPTTSSGLLLSTSAGLATSVLHDTATAVTRAAEVIEQGVAKAKVFPGRYSKEIIASAQATHSAPTAATTSTTTAKYMAQDGMVAYPGLGHRESTGTTPTLTPSPAPAHIAGTSHTPSTAIVTTTSTATVTTTSTATVSSTPTATVTTTSTAIPTTLQTSTIMQATTATSDIVTTSVASLYQSPQQLVTEVRTPDIAPVTSPVVSSSATTVTESLLNYDKELDKSVPHSIAIRETESTGHPKVYETDDTETSTTHTETSSTAQGSIGSVSPDHAISTPENLSELPSGADVSDVPPSSDTATVCVVPVATPQIVPVTTSVITWTASPVLKSEPSPAEEKSRTKKKKVPTATLR